MCLESRDFKFWKMTDDVSEMVMLPDAFVDFGAIEIVCMFT